MKESKYIFFILIIIILGAVLLSYKEVCNIVGGTTGIESYYKNTYINLCEEEYETIEICKYNIEEIKFTPDLYTVFFKIMRSDVLYSLPILGIVIITIASLYSVNKLLKSKYLYYYVQRKNYKSFIIKIFKISYKYILIIPIMISLIYLLSSTLTNHNDNTLMVALGISNYNIIHYRTTGFLILYTLNIMLMYLFYINIGLIIQSYNHKLIFSIIETLIVFFLLEMILENFPQYFWIFDIYNISNYSIYINIFISLIYFIVSFIIVVLVYRNKEKILNRLGA